MRVRTAVLIGGAVHLLAVGGTLGWLYAWREALIKHAIERYGPDFTGVAVKVKSVKLEPVEGLGAIGGLEIGNPPGFTAPHAVTLGEVRLALDPSTLTSDVVHIKEISLLAPSITYERGPNGDNLSAIQKNIESHLASFGGGKGGGKDAGPGRKFIIDRVQVRNARVSYGGALTASVPDLQMPDLGKKTNGASAAEITREIWTTVTRQAISQAPAALEGLRDRARDAVDSVRGLLK